MKLLQSMKAATAETKQETAPTKRDGSNGRASPKRSSLTKY